MDLKSIFSDFCSKINDVETISKNFAHLKTNEDRFELSYNLFQDYATSLTFEKSGKNANRSQEERENGNECFRKNFDWDAIMFYTKSIAFAPEGSEELALALGNRAVCLLLLGLPKEALEDITSAMLLPARPDFKNKCLKRKEKCLNLLQSSKHINLDLGGESVPFLSRDKSSFFDSASSVVNLKESETLGRHLVVSDNVKCGEVLVVEKPLSSILLPDHFYTHCANCLRRCCNLIPCQFCTTSMFCSQKCLTMSQNRNHKIECDILETLVELKAWRMELLSLRILVDMSKQGSELDKLSKEVSEYSNNNKISQYVSCEHVNAYNLVGNTDKRSVADLFYRAATVCSIIIILERFTNFFHSTSHELKMFAGGLLLHYMQSLPCNAHEVSEFYECDLTEIGAALYSTLSLINHSCEPNVVRHSYGDTVVLRTIRPIRRGEEILDNYGYHYATHSVAERQSSLLKQYYFMCQCEACTNFWPLYKNINDKAPVFKETIDEKVYKLLTETFKQNLEVVFKGDFTLDMLESLYTYLDFLDQHVERPWKSYNKCQEAIKHCLSFEANHFIFSKGMPKNPCQNKSQKKE